MKQVIALFGESEKGQFKTPYFLKEISQLMDLLGNPPEESLGLFFAIQALLFQRELIFFRVEEEGFSFPDYVLGLRYLEENRTDKLQAICMPGVGDPEIIDFSQNSLQIHNNFLITNEKDFYDYLSSV